MEPENAALYVFDSTALKNLYIALRQNDASHLAPLPKYNTPSDDIPTTWRTPPQTAG